MPEPQAAAKDNAQVGPGLAGTMVGRYAVRFRLGAGGMGEVYLVEDTKLKRAVALKRMAPRLRNDESFRRRFFKDAEHASRLADQCIAGIYDVLEEKDETFLVMEYVEGEALRRHLTRPFGIGDQVVASVFIKLEIALHSSERLAFASHGTSRPVACDYYLRGLGYLQDYHKPEKIESAIEVFQRALEQDSKYSRAYAGLGEAYWHKYERAQESRWVDQALAACRQASEIEPGLAGGHACLGTVYSGKGRYEEAVREFQQAAQTEPTSDAAYRGLAGAFQRLNKPAEAEKFYKYNVEADGQVVDPGIVVRP